jgi:hypothetical protein
VRRVPCASFGGWDQARLCFAVINKTVMKPAAADLCLVIVGVGRIRLQSSAKLLDQLSVRIGEVLEPLASKASAVALEAIREIPWASDRQFAGTRD